MHLEPLDIVIHLINIVVLYVLLRAILYTPVSRFLEQRRRKVGNMLDEAQAAQREAQDLKISYERRLADAEHEARAIVAAAEEQAAADCRALLDEAHARTQKEAEKAALALREERERGLQELQDETAHLAVEIAARILRREVTAEDNRAVVDAFFEERKGA